MKELTYLKIALFQSWCIQSVLSQNDPKFGDNDIWNGKHKLPNGLFGQFADKLTSKFGRSDICEENGPCTEFATCDCACEEEGVQSYCVKPDGDQYTMCSSFQNGLDDCFCLCPAPDDMIRIDEGPDWIKEVIDEEEVVEDVVVDVKFTGDEICVENGPCTEFASCACGCKEEGVQPFCVMPDGDEYTVCSAFQNGLDDCFCLCPEPDDLIKVVDGPGFIKDLDSDEDAVDGTGAEVADGDDYYDADGNFPDDEFFNIDFGKCYKQACGGTNNTKCDCLCDTPDEVPTCTDRLADDCDPEVEGEGVCLGYCMCAPKVDIEDTEKCAEQFCGGIGGLPCECTCGEDMTEDGTMMVPMCVDDPNDSCDPLAGGADCGGLCQCTAITSAPTAPPSITDFFTEEPTPSPVATTKEPTESPVATTKEPTESPVVIPTEVVNISPSDDWVTITYDDFEDGWGSFQDDGGDAFLVNDRKFIHQGIQAALIRDDSRYSSFSHATEHSLKDFTEMRVTFWFMLRSFEDRGEEFVVQFQDNGSGEWRTLDTFTKNKVPTSGNVFAEDGVTPVTTPLDNKEFYFVDIVVDLTDTDPSTGRLRFKANAGNDSDRAYIDEVTFQGRE